MARLYYLAFHVAVSMRLGGAGGPHRLSIMRFSQLDQITELVPGERITAVKRLSAEEQYLEDHFPRFPVMPGVLMLEAMFQAAAWLVRQSEGFAHSVVLLKEARNVKYSGFVKPGQTLVVSAEIIKQESAAVTLKTQGTVEASVAVNARLILERFNLADRFPSRRETDPYLRNEMRTQLTRLLSAGRSDTARGTH
jgi:3-hydroxyacyl-[acyl-carrier-protein] dehydratase